MSQRRRGEEVSDLLRVGSPVHQGPEIVLVRAETEAMATTSGTASPSNQSSSASPSNQPSNRSLEALFRVTDSELQTLSGRGQRKVRLLPRTISTVTKPTLATSAAAMATGAAAIVTSAVTMVTKGSLLVPERERSTDSETEPASTGRRGSVKKGKPGKHTCPHCARVCAKPSVLEKHIRSHTNERPFPCAHCGFRFKTRSNLYKHQRSTSHQQRVPGSTETTSVSVESMDESFESMEPELSEEAGEDQIIHDVELVATGGILGASSAPLTLVDSDSGQIKTLIRDEDCIGVTVEYTRNDSLMRSSSLEQQTITNEMFSNRVDELISHNSKLLDKNIAPLQRRRLSRQSSDNKSLDSPRIILPSLVPLGTPGTPGSGLIPLGTPGTPGSSKSFSRQNSSLDTPSEDAMIRLPLATSGTPPVINLGNLAGGGVQILGLGSQPGTPILLSPKQINVAPTPGASGSVPILISPTQQTTPVTMATEKASLKEKLKGHLLSRRLQKLQREGSVEAPPPRPSITEPGTPTRRKLSRQVSMDTDTDDVIMRSLERHESQDDVFEDDPGEVIVLEEMEGKPAPVAEAIVQIIQAPVPDTIQNLQILRAADQPGHEDVIILPDSQQQLLLLPTNESLQIFIPGAPSLATNELGAWQNVNVVQSEPTTPVVISMIDDSPDVDVQQLLLGHKYPSLRISTVTSFCTALNLQNVYAVQPGSQISMYSKWRNAPPPKNPTGLSTKKHISLYQTSQRARTYSQCSLSTELKLTPSCARDEYSLPRVSAQVAPSSARPHKFVKSASMDAGMAAHEAREARGRKPGELRRSLSEVPSHSQAGKPRGVEIFPGCIRSDDIYQYVRGRGRGRYVCQQCGIRCRKPSLLKKHFRAHTDLRPYSCHSCRFSFKTKGNLTKHMKSRYHSRKCHELGLLPVPTQVEDSQIDTMMLQLQMKRGLSVDEEGDDDEDEEEIDIEGEDPGEDAEAAHGLESLYGQQDTWLTRGQHVVDREMPCGSEDSSVVMTTGSEGTPKSRLSPSNEEKTDRAPLLGDIMLGTDSRLSTVYGSSCEILANESSLSESVSLSASQSPTALQIHISQSPPSSQIVQSETLSQCSQNEAARSLLDLSRKDVSRAVIGPKQTATDLLIGQHPESLIRQESAPAGLIQPNPDKMKCVKKTWIPTRLGTMYASPPSPQHTKPDSEAPRSGFVPPLLTSDKNFMTKALSLDLSKIQASFQKRKNPTIIEVSPGGDERTLLTSSPSPEVRFVDSKPGKHQNEHKFTDVHKTPHHTISVPLTRAEIEPIPGCSKDTTSSAFRRTVKTISRVSLQSHHTSQQQQQHVSMAANSGGVMVTGSCRSVTMVTSSSRSVTMVRACTAQVPVVSTIPLVSGKSALPKDSSSLLKCTQSVRELIRRYSSGESLEEPHESTKRPLSPSKSVDNILAKRPKLAEILSEDSSSRDTPKSEEVPHPIECYTPSQPVPVGKPRPTDLVVPATMANVHQMASPLSSPLMMPYVVVQGQGQVPGSPLILAQMNNLGMLGQSFPQPFIVQQPCLTPQLGNSPLATVAPATPPVMILSPSLLLNQSGQFQLGGAGGGAQKFVFSPSPLVQPTPMFSSTISDSRPNTPAEITVTTASAAMETALGRGESPVAMETAGVETGSTSSSSSVEAVAPVEMTPMPGKVITEPRAEDGRYVCSVCQASFSHQHQLTLHKKIHAFERNFSCAECNLSYRSAYLLQKHRRSAVHQVKVSEAQRYGQASEENPRPFSCQDCGVAFRIRGHLAKHLRSKQHLLKTDGDFTELRSHSMHDDIRSMSMGDDDVIGDVTDRDVTKTRARLDVGARRRRFASESDSFRRHVTEEEFDDDDVISDDAIMASVTSQETISVTSATASALTKSQSFDAARTKLVAMTKANRSMDVTRETEASSARHEVLVYQCALCSRQFSSLQQLEDHPCTGVPVVRNHVCDTCDAGFTSQVALDNHKLMHNPEQGLPFVCGICGMKFSQLGKLNTHVTTRHAPSNAPWQPSPESVA